MRRLGYTLILVGNLTCLILAVVLNLSDYKLNIEPYWWPAYFVLVAGTLLLFADLARTFMAERKARQCKKD